MVVHIVATAAGRAHPRLRGSRLYDVLHLAVSARVHHAMCMYVMLHLAWWWWCMWRGDGAFGVVNMDWLVIARQLDSNGLTGHLPPSLGSAAQLNSLFVSLASGCGSA